MLEVTGNRPAEIFGYSILDDSDVAQDIRNRRWCPFIDRSCTKRSSLIDFAFGVCTVKHGDGLRTICPHRFEEQGTLDGVPKVFEEIAKHYFGDLNNLVTFSEVRLPKVGSIDFVIVKHKPLKPEVEDFVSVEFQSDSTTGTGHLVKGLRDFFDEQDILSKSYKFGMNTYDSIKRAITQLMNKGVVYEAWDTKCYWVIQDYIYENLVRRYGFKQTGYAPEHASRFALYNLSPDDDGRLTLKPKRYISTTVDEVYQAIRNNPNIPTKDAFVTVLNSKLAQRFGKLQLQLDIEV